MSNSFTYEEPFRKNYEAYAILGWMAMLPIGYFFQSGLVLPVQPLVILIVLAIGMSITHIPGALRTHSRKKDLRGRKKTMYSPKQLAKYMKRNKGMIWYGKGFDWSQRHSQMVYEILKLDENKLIKKNKGDLGSPWIHGMEPPKNEIDLVATTKAASLMTLIVGSTGSGKTRAFETFITQAVMRGEACIVLDPKGDQDMCETTRRACVLAGRPEHFHYFHPAFPQESCKINPVANYNHPTEIASRIAAVIEAGDNPTFRDFGFMAINQVVQGILYSGGTPTLANIKQNLITDIDGLLVKAIQKYCEQFTDDLESIARKYVKNGTDMRRRAIAFCQLYRENFQEDHPNGDIDSLISRFEHDSAHFSKMITSTLPVLTMLTSGDMSDLLSPDVEDRRATNTTNIINNGEVLYLGLDSLSNSTVGQALASITLADLASVAGARYNFGVNNNPVNVFVDEAAECLNDQLIQLLNKGRGSKMNMYLATQTFADFAAKLGDENKAKQVLSNLNNMIVLRTIDNDTQTYITDNLPKTRIGYLQKAHGNNTESGALLGHGGNSGERLMEEEAELFPPQILGKLPDLEYIAKIAGGRLIKGRLPLLCDPKTQEEIDEQKRLRHEKMKRVESQMNVSTVDTEIEEQELPSSKKVKKRLEKEESAEENVV